MKPLERRPALLEKVATALCLSDGGGPICDPAAMQNCKCMVDAVTSVDAAMAALPEMGLKLVETRATAENGLKAALSGEFSAETRFVNNRGHDAVSKTLIGWDTIKQIYAAAVEAGPNPLPEAVS